MKRIFTFLAVFLFSVAIIAQQNHYRWTITGGGTGPEIAEGASADNAGNVYITGAFRSPMNILETEVASAQTTNTMFLAKISPERELLWIVTAEADGITGAGGFKTV